MTGFYVYYKITGTTSYSKTSLISMDLFAYSLTGLKDKNYYAMKIVAANTKGESEYSPIVY